MTSARFWVVLSRSSHQGAPEAALTVSALETLPGWCRERLAAYKVPSYIEFRDMLPKSKVGKLLRREVRDDELRRISKEGKKTFQSKGA